jgi:hypothetical protein
VSRSLVGDAYDERCFAVDADPVVFGTDANTLGAKTKRQSEGGPSLRQAGIDGKAPALGREPEEAGSQGLPQAAHRCEMESLTRGAREVVEVEPGGEAEELERALGFPGAREHRGVDGRRE